MTESFIIDLFDGHLIFEHNGLKVLVDTGSPVTISKCRDFAFMGNQYPCLTNFLGKDISQLSSMMGYNIDVLMGLDLITEFFMMTDYQKKEITFSTEEISFQPQCSVPIAFENGMICVQLNVEGQSVNLVLDTGARISYIDEAFTDGRPIIETREDFSPLMGIARFSTPIYSMQVSVENMSFPVNFGKLPSQIALMLKMMGVYGAIGYDLFNTFTVLMDYKNNQLLLKPVIRFQTSRVALENN